MGKVLGMNQTGLTTDQLTALKCAHSVATDKRHADRLKAVYLWGKGWTAVAVAEALLMDRETVARHVARYQAKGLAGNVIYFSRNENRIFSRPSESSIQRTTQVGQVDETGGTALIQWRANSGRPVASNVIISLSAQRSRIRK